MERNTDGYVKGTNRYSQPLRTARRKKPAPPPGRKCTRCGVTISQYNRNPTCWNHTTTRIQELEDRDV